MGQKGRSLTPRLTALKTRILTGHLPSRLRPVSCGAGIWRNMRFKSQVVLLVAKCGDSTSPDVQLTVIKALLTITTAEHFRVHGDCLVQVRPPQPSAKASADRQWETAAMLKQRQHAHVTYSSAASQPHCSEEE